MTIEMDPIRLIKLRSIPGRILGVKMIMSCGDKGLVVYNRFLIGLFPGERITSWLLFVYVTVLLLLGCAYFPEVLLKLLCWSEAWQ
jgi:hypothetical protein